MILDVVRSKFVFLAGIDPHNQGALALCGSVHREMLKAH